MSEELKSLKDISFTGITGRIEFEDNGDREVGAGCTILNHDGTAYQAVGDWDQSTNFVLKTGVTEADFVWPTASGEKIKDVILPLCTTDDIGFIVADCGANSKRSITFAVAVDDGQSPICEGGESKPDDLDVDCEYSPINSTSSVLASTLGVAGAIFCGICALWVALNAKDSRIPQFEGNVKCRYFVRFASLIKLKINLRFVLV